MLQKSSTLKTAEIFFLEPTKEHYLMEISRKIKIAHTSTKNNLDKLARQGMIKKQIKTRASRRFPIFTANIDNSEYKNYKRLFNYQTIIEIGLIKHIQDKLMPKTIVLFGSYFRGEDIENSDIDIFIECKKQNINLDKFNKKLKRTIELHFKEDFKKYPKELKNNIMNGITLSGFLEGFR